MDILWEEVVFSMEMNNTCNISTSKSISGMTFYLFYYIPLGILSLFCVIGNGIVIYLILKYDELRTPVNYFLLSLAISDFCEGVLFSLYQINHIDVTQIRRVFGTWGFCTSLLVLVVVAHLGSAYNLVAVTISRSIHIVYPFKASDILSPRRCLSAVVVIWLFSITWSCIMYLRLQPERGTYCGICYTEFAYSVFTPANLLASLILAALIIMCVYIWMVIKLEREMKNCTVTLNSSVLDRQKIRTTTSRLVGCAMVCWTPLTVYLVVQSVDPTYYISPYVRATVRLLMLSNSAVNVVVYTGSMSSFRKALKKEFGCCFAVRSSSSPQPSTTVKTICNGDSCCSFPGALSLCRRSTETTSRNQTGFPAKFSSSPQPSADAISIDESSSCVPATASSTPRPSIVTISRDDSKF